MVNVYLPCEVKTSPPKHASSLHGPSKKPHLSNLFTGPISLIGARVYSPWQDGFYYPCVIKAIRYPSCCLEPLFVVQYGNADVVELAAGSIVGKHFRDLGDVLLPVGQTVWYQKGEEEVRAVVAEESKPQQGVLISVGGKEAVSCSISQLSLEPKNIASCQDSFSAIKIGQTVWCRIPNFPKMMKGVVSSISNVSPFQYQISLHCGITRNCLICDISPLPPSPSPHLDHFHVGQNVVCFMQGLAKEAVVVSLKSDSSTALVAFHSASSPALNGSFSPAAGRNQEEAFSEAVAENSPSKYLTCPLHLLVPLSSCANLVALENQIRKTPESDSSSLEEDGSSFFHEKENIPIHHFSHPSTLYPLKKSSPHPQNAQNFPIVSHSIESSPKNHFTFHSIGKFVSPSLSSSSSSANQSFPPNRIASNPNFHPMKDDPCVTSSSSPPPPPTKVALIPNPAHSYSHQPLQNADAAETSRHSSLNQYSDSASRRSCQEESIAALLSNMGTASSQPPSTSASSSLSTNLVTATTTAAAAAAAAAAQYPHGSMHCADVEPYLKKRKLFKSKKSLYKCTWIGCGRILGTVGGIKRHIVNSHFSSLGENQDEDEDFYYTEIEGGGDTEFHLSHHIPHHTAAAGHQSSMAPQEMNSMIAGGHLLPPFKESLSMKEGIKASSRPYLVEASKEEVDSKSDDDSDSNSLQKCRKRYGLARKSEWCSKCRWKKACERFI